MSQEANDKAKEEMPNTEVVAKASAGDLQLWKKRVLWEAEACRGSGEIGALLRREGLYSSYLTTWRRQQELGKLEGLSPQNRGPKPDLQAVELAKLRRENERFRCACGSLS
jgi:transposase